jgi:hypothetical protein
MFKKKAWLMLLSLVLMLTLFAVGCGETTSNGNKTNDGAAVTKNKDQVPIRFEDIKPEIKILKPDSIGTVYMEATFTNNSQFPITGYDLKVLLKDKNERAYLTIYETVMPGETSPKFEGFGPQTQDPNDYEIIGLTVEAKKDDGKKLSIEYDFKLDEATWHEYKD